MIWQRSPWRGRVAAVLAATAFQAASAAVVRGQSGAAEDRAALEALYDATGGANWTDSTNWKTDTPLSAWHGVTTDDAGRVTDLELDDNALSGPIPDALGRLSNLEYLFLDGNALSGPIPDALGRLSNLERLDLDDNALSGLIPDALGRLSNLEYLYLNDNALSGPIPDALGRLANLQALRLGDNELNGPIPDWLGSLSNLEELGLGNNALSGQIPEALGSLSNLEYLDLSSNALSGPVPDWLGSLANLRDLYLYSNALSGPVPDWLGSLANLQVLRLEVNELSGPIPEALGNLANLEVLHLSLNELSGPIPDALGSLANLQSLHLYGNALTGPVPDWLGSLANLQWLRLEVNELSGPIPDALGSLANLETLYLNDNELSGPIPDALGSLSSLEGLRLDSNVLTGPVPDALGRLANLEELNLDNNDLSGPVPDALGRLANLQYLRLGWNWLTGTLPTELTQLSALDFLSIHATGVCAPVAAFREWLAALDTFWGDTCPLPPQPVGTMPAQTLGPARGVPAEPYFSDPNDDPLTWSAASSNPRTVGAFVSGDTVWLVPGAAGGAVVTVTARDPGGLSAAQDMAVTTVEADDPQSDRVVLEVFYDFTGGENWTDSANWKTPAPLGAWRGVTTDAAGRVTGLELDDNELTGPIPDALGRLANLERLSLSGNELSGPIPDELGSLANLEYLDLSSNDLSGPIPAALGRLSNLQSMSLYYNELSGPIPDALGSLANLRWLSLRGNALSGPIPAALGSLANLRGLNLEDNALSGPIPDALGRLANLRILYFNDNALSGPIPDELGRLANLERLALSHAWGLSGPLPPGLRSAASLVELDIFLAQACAPAAWRDWLKTIDFRGRLCRAEAATVDVAVVHTPAAREAAGGAAEIEALIDLMVAESNQAYEASGVPHRVALASRAEVQYVESGSAELDLYRLSEPSDGHMDEAHALRDRVGADLVHLIVDGDKTDWAGLAYLDGAFGLTGHDTVGGGTFAHELGHNFGAEHDRYEVHHYEGGTSPHPAYGYVNQPGLRFRSPRSSRWVTIMSYRTQCAEDGYTICWRLNRFSNPRQQYGGDRLGVPFGAGGSGATGPADAAAVLDATMPAAALWRERPPRPNRPPTAAGALPDRTLPLPGAVTVDVSQAFVDPDGDTLAWSVSSSAPGVVAVAAADARVTLTAVGLGTAQIRVTATDPGGLSASQSFTATVTDRPPASFTDDPIRPGATPIRAVHFTELRSRIDGLRQAAGLTPFAWTDPVLRAGETPVRLVHLLELRQALAAAYQAAGRTPPRWIDAAPAAGSTPIRAAHLTELRAAVVALE